MTTVHPTSVVEPGAELGEAVVIGPFCHVQAGARVGDGTRLESHVVICGTTHLGARNLVAPFAVLGGRAQSLRVGADGRVAIGDDNVIRESVTINAPREGGITRVGSHNLLMNGCHVAHDTRVGDHCVLANGVQLAGHAVVADWVTFGGLAGIAQHVHVGDSAFVAAGSMCERDVPPFVIVQGDRARPRGINVVGLRRRGVPEASVRALRAAYSHVFTSGRYQAALSSVDRTDRWVAAMVTWLEAPERDARRKLSR